jgi:hypothetical protein
VNPLLGRQVRCEAFPGHPVGIVCDMHYVEVEVDTVSEIGNHRTEKRSDWSLLVLMSATGLLSMTLASTVVVL